MGFGIEIYKIKIWLSSKHWFPVYLWNLWLIISENHEEFMVEIETIGHATHKNLVKLIGYSIEGDHR